MSYPWVSDMDTATISYKNSHVHKFFQEKNKRLFFTKFKPKIKNPFCIINYANHMRWFQFILDQFDPNQKKPLVDIIVSQLSNKIRKLKGLDAIIE